jgi:16S rRNA (adenine1518-N6/adenine1519-N6)-dimethyltransferase
MVMVQKEVAVKFSSKVGDRTYSALSILADSICEAELLFDVGAECFEPPPKITSAVLKLTKFSNYENLFEKKEDIARFKSFLKAAFAAPRKTLIKNLGQIVPKEDLIREFEKLEIPLNYRPHQVESKTYHLLFKNLK